MQKKDETNRKTVIMNFSGVYREEDFWKEEEVLWLDFQKLSGVNCYCTQEAEEKIKEGIQNLPLEGIHFLDSGNYHYLTKFWLEKFREPFSLLVFDNHTDMQEAAFFGLLSCGSWALEVLEGNSLLSHICTVGPPQKDFQESGGDTRERMTEIWKEELSEKGEEKLLRFLEEETEVPLYISIDKDVLRDQEARTNWDQGNMPLEQLLKWLELAFGKRKVIGVDICGENPPDTAQNVSGEDLGINSRTNKILLEFLKNRLKKEVILD